MPDRLGGRDAVRVLGVESSCDDTAVAVVEDGCRVRSNVVSSQLEHAEFGGVVPEIAARRHLDNLPTVLESALAEAGTDLGKIDGIAVTRGPGLIGALLAGWCFARGLARSTGLPWVGVHHLAAHVHAALMPALEEGRPIPWPLVALVVSGGHTSLYRLPGPARFETLGQTRDDAAGEAFDKVASLLGLGYPGGPVIDRLAADGDPAAHDLPRS
ncbi:MAG: tRNA (adenosine(37)-N6)-threonylcarbamoyltransferase complex transferase subunit TsaD, partial [Acidobacteriota bacterium]